MVGIQVADTARWPRSYSPGSLPGRGRAGSGGLERHRGREPPPGSPSRAPAAVSGLLISNPGPGPCRWTVPPAPCACARGASARARPRRAGPAPGGSQRLRPRRAARLSPSFTGGASDAGAARRAPTVRRVRAPPRERASVRECASFVMVVMTLCAPWG